MNIQNRPYFFPLLITLVFLFSYTWTFDSKLAPLGDNASYYMLGQALAQGEGYVNISKIDKTPNNHYPPGYPAIMSIFMMFTDSIAFFKVLNGLFLLGGLLLFYRIFLLALENRVLAFATVLMCLLNFHLLQYGSMMMSEVPFLFFSAAALLLFMTRKDRPWLSDPAFYLVLAAIVAGYYIRSLGIALTGAAVITLFLRKKVVEGIALGGGFVLLALPWFIRSQQLGGGSYMKQLTMINPYQPNLGTAGFGDFVDRAINNFTRYLTEEIPHALFPFTEVNYQEGGTAGDWFAGLLLAALIIYGIISLRKFRWFIGLYILFTLLILMLWPDVWVGVRFIVPLIPLLALGLFSGLNTMLNRVFSAANKTFPSWVTLFVPLMLLSSVSTLHEQSSVRLHPAWANYYAMGEWLRQNAPEETVVSCGKPALFYLYSRTYTMRYPFEQDAAKLIQELEDARVDYVVIDQVYPNTFRYLLPAIRSQPERFEQVYHRPNPDTYLLRFKR